MKIAIDRPCSQSANSLRGPPERPYCASCERHVHNLSMMTEAEAHAFLRTNREQSLCIRLDQTSDGNPRFRDVVPAASLTRRLAPVGLAVSIVAVIAAGVSTVVHTSYGGIDGARHRRPRDHEPGQTRDTQQVLVDSSPDPAEQAPASTSHGGR